MDKPFFEVERTYTRREIYNILGGDLVSNFPAHQGRVIYCCVPQYPHPDAPEIILIGSHGRMAEIAKRLASQHEAIPVFLKQKGGEFVYRGEFVVKRYSDNRAEVAPYAKKAARSDIVGVLFLQRVS